MVYNVLVVCGAGAACFRRLSRQTVYKAQQLLSRCDTRISARLIYGSWEVRVVTLHGDIRDIFHSQIVIRAPLLCTSFLALRLSPCAFVFLVTLRAHELALLCVTCGDGN